jgi:uncharacterized protein (TIGR02145 family)
MLNNITILSKYIFREVFRISITYVTVFLLSASAIIAQNNSLEITFTAIDSTSWKQLDSIRVMNRNQGGDTLLHWPDTVLILDYSVGIADDIQQKDRFRLFQNYPNPVVDQTIISMYLPNSGEVHVIIADIKGKRLVDSKDFMPEGLHSFRFSPPGGKIYICSVEFENRQKSIKLISHADRSETDFAFEYSGLEAITAQLKTSNLTNGFSFSLYDTLLYVGYADSLESGILDAPVINNTQTFIFTTNIPCPGIPTVLYEGQLYNTIQIFSQCWLKENLNVGSVIPGSQEMSDNGIIEKYCYDNDTMKCQVYGGLYQWDEMMDYRLAQGSQGICPEGWHIPTDEEWKVLEGSVDSYYGIGDAEWDEYWSGRGADAGKNLKSIEGWPNSNSLDLFGFKALPGGNRGGDGAFNVGGSNCAYWTSSVKPDNNWGAWIRSISYLTPKITRNYNVSKSFGLSVRCIKTQ